MSPFAVSPAVGRSRVVMYSPSRVGPQPLPSDVAMKAQSCGSTLIVASRVQQDTLHRSACSSQPRVPSWQGTEEVAQTFLGILGVREAHACSAQRYWKTCFASCLPERAGLGRGLQEVVWTALSLDRVNMTDVRLHESFQQRRSLSRLLTCSSASQFRSLQQFLFI